MKNKTTAIAVLLLFFNSLPAFAVMGEGMGRHRHGQMHREEIQEQEPHYHGNYKHSHQGGELPHNHGEEGRIIYPPAAPDAKGETEASQPVLEEATPAPEPLPQPSEPGIAKQPGQVPEASAIPAPGDVSETDKSAAIQGQDDMVLRLVPGGSVGLPEPIRPEGTDSIEVAPFYMDETQVTNHQYVDFLNQNIANVKVEKGVVRGEGGDIWLFLGEVKEGYEPIIFKNDAFSINGVHHSACAVLRVTGHGAQAYAHFFGKRLPTEAEWLYAANAVSEIELPIPSPVALYPANSFGVRGLNSNIAEWSLRKQSASPNINGEEAFVILGGFTDVETRDGNLSAGVVRYPWEGFSETGFRGVISASAQGK